MNKIIIKILIGISIFIIAFGIIAANSIKSEIREKSGVLENDTTDVVTGIVEISTGLLGFAMVVYSFSAVASIWIIYGIIYLIIILIKKYKLKKQQITQQER